MDAISQNNDLQGDAYLIGGLSLALAVHFILVLYFTAPSEGPSAILFWMKQKKRMEGMTTMAQAAIKEPQFRISAPSSVFTATDIVVLSELLIRIIA